MTDLPETPPADYDDGDLPESELDEDIPEIDKDTWAREALVSDLSDPEDVMG